MNKKIILVLGLFLLAILLVIATLFSYAEFGSLNLAATAAGLVRVCALEEPYVQIGFLFKSYVSQSEGGLDMLISLMESQGYIHLPDEQMGSLHMFADSQGLIQPVYFTQNAHFARWIWY